VKERHSLKLKRVKSLKSGKVSLTYSTWSRILFQNIYSNNYIEQDYIEEDTVSVTYVIAYR
jgi:hypothetical protein